MSRGGRGPAADRYATIPVRTVDDLRALGLPSPPANPISLYMWLATGPLSSRVPGVTRAGRAAIAEAIDWPQPDFDAAFAALAAVELARADWTARVVFLPAALGAECARATSPSTAACWRREIVAVPACPLRDEIDQVIRSMLSPMAPAFLASYDAGRRTDDPRQPAAQPAALPAAQPGQHLSPSPSPSPALSPAPSRKKVRASAGRAQRPKETRPRWSEIIGAYCDAWKSAHGVDGRGPVIDGADSSALAGVYDREGADEALALVHRFVADADPHVTRRGHILRDLPARVTAYRSRQASLAVVGGARPVPSSEIGDLTDRISKHIAGGGP